MQRLLSMQNGKESSMSKPAVKKTSMLIRYIPAKGVGTKG